MASEIQPFFLGGGQPSFTGKAIRVFASDFVESGILPNPFGANHLLVGLTLAPYSLFHPVPSRFVRT